MATCYNWAYSPARRPVAMWLYMLRWEKFNLEFQLVLMFPHHFLFLRQPITGFELLC